MSSYVRVLFLLILISTLVFEFLKAQPNQNTNTIQARYNEKPIVLDGKLNDSAWLKAQTINNFIQREPQAGKKVSENTKVAITYNEKYFYVAIWCYDDHPSKITATELERDFSANKDDNFQLILDTYNDDRNGFLFITNPNGARKEGQVFDNGESKNMSWDGVWDVETSINDKGWFAEIKIPFSTLKYRTTEGQQTWGINFERNIRRKREQASWQGWSRDASIEQVNRAGTVKGLQNLVSKDFIEVKPYAIGGGEFKNNNETELDAGGDINYLITPTLQAKLTVNTDFAQVEADQQKINLSRFPLAFKEKREFFLEGQDYFNMGFGGNRVTPFYSRRIGLTKNRKRVPILAGGRILGKVDDATLGAMSVQTGRNGATPPTNYTVASWRQDVLKQSTVGAMTVNKFDTGRWHTTSGINARYSTSKLFDNKNLNMGGALVQSYNSNEEIKSKANAYRVYLNYPNDKLSIYTSYQRSPSPFQPEVALMRRRNFQEAFGTVSIKPRPSNDGWLSWIRQFTFTPGTVTYTFFHDTKELQTFSYIVTPLKFNTNSGETFSFTMERNGERLKEPFNIKEGVTIPRGEYWQTRYRSEFSTFGGRTLSGTVNVSWGDFFGGNNLESSYKLNLRASKYLQVNLNYEKNWVHLPQGNFQTNLVGNRLNYAFNPDIFGSVFAQWNDDQELANVNFRLEWIPKLGTNFYLIYNQNFDTATNRWRNQRTTILGKLVWRFVI